MFKKINGNMLLFTIFSLIIGIVLIVYPQTSQKVICYSVSGLAIVYGFVHIALHFLSRESFAFPTDLVLGITGIVIGIIILLNPSIILLILPIIFGIIVIIDGLMKIMNAFDLLKESFNKWWLILIMGTLCIALGLFMIFYIIDFPILTFTGIALIVNGIFDAYNVMVIMKYKKD